MAIAEGVQQMVLLGGGFDSRPYRLPECGRLAVFEVNHPATLASSPTCPQAVRENPVAFFVTGRLGRDSRSLG